MFAVKIFLKVKISSSSLQQRHLHMQLVRKFIKQMLKKQISIQKLWILKYVLTFCTQ